MRPKLAIQRAPAPRPEEAPGLACSDVETYELPCADGLMAAGIALMTAFAQPASNACQPPAKLRLLLARKIVSHLEVMGRHPAIQAPLRQVLAQARVHWLQVLQSELAAQPHVL